MALFTSKFLTDTVLVALTCSCLISSISVAWCSSVIISGSLCSNMPSFSSNGIVSFRDGVVLVEQGAHISLFLSFFTTFFGVVIV